MPLGMDDWSPTDNSLPNWFNVPEYTQYSGMFSNNPNAQNHDFEYMSPTSLASIFANNGGDLAGLGFTGNAFTNGDWDGETGSPGTYTPEFSNWLNQNGYKLNYANPEGSGLQYSYLTDPNGKMLSYGSIPSDSGFGPIGNFALQALTTGLMTGGLGSMMGGAGIGSLGQAAGQGALGGSLSSMQGGKFLQGFAGGALGSLANTGIGETPEIIGNNPSAYVPAQPGLTPAGAMGVTNSIGAKMINSGLGGALGNLAGGNSLKESLQAGLTSAAGAGISQGLNQFGKNFTNTFSSLLGQEGLDPETGDFPGSGGTNMEANQEANIPSFDPSSGEKVWEGTTTGSPYVDWKNSISQENPTMTAQSASDGLTYSGASVPSLGDIRSWAGNHLGDIATSLYGVYNNRKQSKELSNQMQSLRDLYSSSSPYAQQLKNKITAEAAAKGHRANTAGREVQLQAALADRYASLAPALFQLQQSKGQLQNSLMNNALTSFGKMGGWDGLKSLFNWQTPYQYNNGNVTGSETFGWKGPGGF